MLAPPFFRGSYRRDVCGFDKPKKLFEYSEQTRMLLHKPIYGQLDAPRVWFLEATRRLTSSGLRPHLLDPCAFLICEADFPDIKPTDPSKCSGAERIVGMVCIHVDDMLGDGLGESKVYQHVVAPSTSVSGRVKVSRSTAEPRS